jgi:hypothetical protein
MSGLLSVIKGVSYSEKRYGNSTPIPPTWEAVDINIFVYSDAGWLSNF